MKNLFLILCLLFAWSNAVFAQQIKVNAVQNKICLDNLSNFRFIPPSGKSIVSYKWDFGDGSSSIQNAPSYLYKTPGIYTVRVNAKDAGGTIHTASLSLEVVPLPKANFIVDSKSDFCLYSNNICFKDGSNPGKPGQTITSKLIIWGDGEFAKASGNQNQFCHQYALEDSYPISIEITDKYGCKDFLTDEITILPDLELDIRTSVDYPKCGEAQVCIQNRSASINDHQYTWNINGAISYNTYSFPWCQKIHKDSIIIVNTIGQLSGFCRDTFTDTLLVVIDTNRVLTMPKDTFCYSEKGFYFTLDEKPEEQVSWWLDDSIQNAKSLGDYTGELVLFKANNLFPGKHRLNLEIRRGNCIQLLTKDFFIAGPVASIQAYPPYQCFTNRRVFVWQDTAFQKPGLKYLWDMGNPKGDLCTNHRAKGQNLFKNCNNSIDWYAKQDYEDFTQYTITLYVSDSSSGCADTAYQRVDLTACGMCQGLCDMEFSVCANREWNPGLDTNVVKKISFDTGKTWVKFPAFLDTSLVGTHEIGFVIKRFNETTAEDIWEDSIKINYGGFSHYDTLFCNIILHIKDVIMDSIYTSADTGCKPHTVKLNFHNGKFKKGDLIFVKWDDNQQVIKINSDTSISHVLRTFDTAGLQGTVRVIFNRDGCQDTLYAPYAFGRLQSIKQLTPLCTNGEICFDADVYETAAQEYWGSDGKFGTVEWLLNDRLVYNYPYYCDYIPVPGTYNLKLVTKDKQGCTDTTEKEIIVQEITADVTDDTRAFYCNQLKQFFDSSRLAVNHGKDEIVNYWWDFGTKKYTTVDKDPFKSFVGVSDDITVSHIVESKFGCRDTIEFTMTIIGSKPSFELTDTIGCAPFYTRFINTSVNASLYIWEFGDPDGNTLSTDEDTSVGFNYTQPGQFSVSLVGIDTVYNPYTGSVYYCNARYPSGTKKMITVLPSYKTGIESVDTVCLGDDIIFKSLSDTGFQADFWYFGDGSKAQTSTGKGTRHTYTQTGEYDVVLAPYYPRLPNVPYCHDSAQKKVVVLGVEADFQQLYNANPPIFNFENLSTPMDAQFTWRYKAPSEQPSDHVVHGSYNYGLQKGFYTVCLEAALPFGCKDEKCIEIENDYEEDLTLYNVFTPGGSDSLNNYYDVTITGEEHYHLIIYNRWGQVVYDSREDFENQDSRNWNGRVRNTGPLCPEGTYYYVFEFSFRREPDNLRKTEGVITLIRE